MLYLLISSHNRPGSHVCSRETGQTGWKFSRLFSGSAPRRMGSFHLPCGKPVADCSKRQAWPSNPSRSLPPKTTYIQCHHRCGGIFTAPNPQVQHKFCAYSQILHSFTLFAEHSLLSVSSRLGHGQVANVAPIVRTDTSSSSP